MKKDVVGLGQNFMDFAVHLNRLPTKKDEGAAILQTSWQGGGNVASAMAAFGQLGGSGSMMGMAGADAYGQFLVEDFANYGIDTSHIIRDGRNVLSFVLSDDVTRGRNILIRPGTSRAYTPQDLDAEFIAGHKMLHIESCNDTGRAAIKIMHGAGGLVAMDAGGFSPMTAEVLGEIDVFIGSEFYYKHVFGEDTAYQANMKSLWRAGQVLVFTLGEKGCAVLWQGGFALVPGFEVDVVDTLGAGDVFHGGYLYALTHGYNPVEAGRFANAVAAIKCTSIGGRTGTPNCQMVMDFLATGTYDRTLIDEKVKRYESFNGITI